MTNSGMAWASGIMFANIQEMPAKKLERSGSNGL
jgi:hypothetical protein